MTQAEPEIVAPEISLSQRTSRGFAWMLAQTLGSKVVGIAGQVFLARLLVPRDFGLVALAYSAAAPGWMLRQTGVPQILVQKGDRFKRWANAAFWMDLSLGLATAVLLLISGPLAAVVFKAPQLVGLLQLISTTALLNGLMTVPQARLTRDMRFRELALVGLGYNVLAMAISVAAASLGLGAYSLVIPLPICLSLRALAVWRLAPVRIRPNPQLHRWRAMAPDSGRLMVAAAFGAALWVSCTLALGLFYSPPLVGFFSFAGSLSAQVSTLLSANLAAVLFPVLSTLRGDPPRQVAAFFRSARALALAGVPLCLAEAVLARPLLLAVFGAKWLPAAPLLTLLALSAAIGLVGGPAGNLMQAQGRFHLSMKWSVASAVLVVVLAFPAARWGGPAWVAATWLICTAALTPALLRSAARPGGGAMPDVARIYLPPLLLSALALAPAALGELFFPWLWAHPWADLGLAAITAPPLYAALLRRFRRADLDELVSHLRRPWVSVESAPPPAG